MTTPTPQPDVTPAPYSPPPAGRSRTRLIVAAAIAGAVLLLAAAVTVGVWLANRDSLSRETAQRECRTALEREAERRSDNLGGAGTTGVLVTLSGVELEETWETDAGWSVNGKATYTLTTPLLGKNDTTVSLTCDATPGDDGQVKTTVKNRT